jgi:hypothetical protein
LQDAISMVSFLVNSYWVLLRHISPALISRANPWTRCRIHDPAGQGRSGCGHHDPGSEPFDALFPMVAATLHRAVVPHAASPPGVGHASGSCIDSVIILGIAMPLKPSLALEVPQLISGTLSLMLL